MPAATPPIERALGLCGGALVLGLAVYLLHSAWQGQGHGTPAVTLALGPARALGTAGWIVPFRAVNQGSAPAAGLGLEAVLALSDGRRERSEVVVDYLASGAEQEGGFFFAVDPAQGTLTTRPLGYLRP
jgi:uncharacterized protein (TIGR02588 family)